MKKYLLGALAIALVVVGSAFINKSQTSSVPVPPQAVSSNEDVPFTCVWFQFIGTAGSQMSVMDNNNYIETSNPTGLCDAGPKRACAVCINTSKVTGTAPNRHFSGVSIGAAKYVPDNTWYVIAAPGGVDMARNRN